MGTRVERAVEVLRRAVFEAWSKEDADMIEDFERIFEVFTELSRKIGSEGAEEVLDDLRIEWVTLVAKRR
jgi:hypothetical protein